MVVQLAATMVVFGVTGYFACSTLEDAGVDHPATAYVGLSSVLLGSVGTIIATLGLIWS